MTKADIVNEISRKTGIDKSTVLTTVEAFMDTVKEFDVVYDDTKDNNSISYDEVRKDVAKPSFPTEKLLSNTQPSGNCYVVPKMVD